MFIARISPRSQGRATFGLRGACAHLWMGPCLQEREHAPVPCVHSDGDGGPRLKGESNTAQGNALGIPINPAQALKGRYLEWNRNGIAWPGMDRVGMGLAPLPPLQGFEWYGDGIPRAMPWALLFPPFRLELRHAVILSDPERAHRLNAHSSYPHTRRFRACE